MHTRGGLVVLCYHAISAAWPSNLAVSPVRLREQLRYLLRRGYTGATFTEAVRGRVRGKTVAVTFDDGNISVLERALPILAELGLPGTVFVSTSLVGRSLPISWPEVKKWKGSPHERELLCLDWDQLRSLQAAGWEIGAHTRTHPSLPDVDAVQLQEELVGPMAELTERMGKPCRSLAYPYGDFDDRVAEAAGRAGYEAAGTMRPGPPDHLRFPRVGVFPADGNLRFRAKVSQAVLRMRASHPGRLVESRRHTPRSVS